MAMRQISTYLLKERKPKKTSRPKEPCTPRLVITKRLFGIALAPNFNLARAGAMLTVLF